MLRVSKMTDYAIVLMTCLARREATEMVAARDLASTMGLPQPTVSKLLKMLTQGELLTSTRGVSGGYALARKPEDISLVEMIEAIEGPLSMTDCSSEGNCDCDIQPACGLRANWTYINGQLMSTLRGITLRGMTGSVAQDLKTMNQVSA